MQDEEGGGRIGRPPYSSLQKAGQEDRYGVQTCALPIYGAGCFTADDRYL